MTTEAVEGHDSAARIGQLIRIRKILVPIDGSEFSLDAAKYAIKITKYENAQIICFHAITTSLLEYAWTPESREDLKTKVESWFDTIKGIAKTSGIPEVKTQIFLDVKSIVECIVDYATNENIDLIVIGTRGRTGLKKFMMGSVANDVARHTHCPVLLIR